MSELSGRVWVGRFPTERTTAGLEPKFRGRTIRFITAMEAAGIEVKVNATKRPEERAYLMHWSWRIAREGYDPALVPAHPNVDIRWTHPTPDASKKAAADMVAAYALAYKPSLTSKHIAKAGQGAKAIDMSLFWEGKVTVIDASGQPIEVDSLYGNESNTVLHRVGATYGVYKLVSDQPHWSDNGH
jgi:hypothetical protein